VRREPRRGDGERSFERLYRRHRADVYRALLRELGNREDAEDVMQTAFLDAYRALERGGRPERPRAWLLTIAENARRRRFRAQRRRPEEAALSYEPAAGEAEVTAAELRDALERLPPNQRAVLVLREVAGFSYAEIAMRLELSVPSVQMLLFRSRRALRAELEGLGGRRPRGVPAWPVPPWLAEGFHSSGGSLGLLPRAAGVVAAGAMGAAVVTGTATLSGARPHEEPQRARPQPTSVVADPHARPPAARAPVARAPAARAPAAARTRPPARAARPAALARTSTGPAHAAPPAPAPPAPTPPAAPLAAPALPARPAPAESQPDPPSPASLPIPEVVPPVAPLAPPVGSPPAQPVPTPPEPALPALPALPQLPPVALPELPVPAPPAGTGESGGAAIPGLRPS
jgi:RNA polymerase sigma factor (sigma-70 family)